MEFRPIHLESWNREEYFQHYLSAVPCTYSMTVKLDITAVAEKKQKLYPAMLHSITAVVNRHEEFRTALDQHGNPGVFDAMIPCYTVFHPETETFSNLWTPYRESYQDFLAAYLKDQEEYGGCQGLVGKPNPPENTFPVSMIPWAPFDAFHLDLQKGYQYLLPIFTMGKYQESAGRRLLPLSVQVHHAVCDGFHLCRFLNELQDQING